MPPQLSLKETLFALKDSLHSLDIRAAVKLGDSDWLCLLTVIRISARSVEEVAQHHRRLESKCDRPDAGDFRILLEALPFSHIDSWLTRLSEASLLVNGFQVRLPQPVAEETLRGSVNRYDNFLIPSEGKESPHIDFYSGTRSISFQDLAVIRTAYSMGWPSAEAAATFFLGLKENEVGRSSVSIYFQIEMPAIIEIGTTDHESMKLQVTAEKHLEDLALYFSVDSLPQRLALEELGDDGRFKRFHAKRKLSEEEKGSDFSCHLTASKIPVLDEIYGRLSTILPLAAMNPLYVCLKQFWKAEEFSRRLERPYTTGSRDKVKRAQRDFEQSIAALLALAGLQAIPLGDEEFIRDPDTNIIRSTLDILAYCPSQHALVLGACVMDAPKPDDITKLLETKAILSELFPPNSRVGLVPIVFSAQAGDSDDTMGVRIFNANKLRRLRQLIERGEEQIFLSSLTFPLGNGFG